MATSQSTSINVDARAVATKNGRSTTGYITHNRQMANGTSADQSDKGYYDYRTIAYTSTPDNLDFVGGGLIDLNGDTISWAEMTGLVIKNEDLTNSLTVGGHANPLNFGAGANTITIHPGETKVLINCGVDGAYPLSGGATDTLKVLAASGTNVIYQIWATGRSA